MMRLKMMRCARWQLIAAIGASLLVGCAPQAKFGGRLCTVKLTSDEPADAYLISNQRYLETTGTAAADNALLTDKHFKGPTPTEVKIMPYLWVYIAQRKSDGFVSRPITFNPNELTNGTVKAMEFRNAVSH